MGWFFRWVFQYLRSCALVTWWQLASWSLCWNEAVEQISISNYPSPFLLQYMAYSIPINSIQLSIQKWFLIIYCTANLYMTTDIFLFWRTFFFYLINVCTVHCTQHVRQKAIKFLELLIWFTPTAVLSALYIASFGLYPI